MKTIAPIRLTARIRKSVIASTAKQGRSNLISKNYGLFHAAKAGFAMTACTALVLILTGFKFAHASSLSYDELERKSREHSPRLKALGYEAEAAEARAGAQKSLFFPKLTLEGMYKYNEVVPEFTLPAPLNLTRRLGDNKNYSLGPSLSWILWDNGSVRNNWRSFKAARRAKGLEIESVTRQIDLTFARAYFQALLYSEQVLQVNDALALAARQYKDVLVNVKAGSKSRRDELSAHAEKLGRERQLAQAVSDLKVSLQDLSAFTGIEITVPEGKEYPALEPLDVLIEKFKVYENAKPWAGHPDLMASDELIRSAQFAQEGVKSGLWPKASVSARSSIDYPNGPKLEEFNQNSVGAAISMPLFEGRQTRSKAQEAENQAKAAREQKRQKEIDQNKLIVQTQIQLENYKKQYDINETMIKEAQELSGIVYKSYNAGSATWLEVENANYRLLEAKIQQSRTKVQMLMQYAILKSLAER